MQAAQFTTSPAFVAAAAANILNGAVSSLAGPVGVTLPQPIVYIKKIQLANATGTGRAVTLFLGATGGSTAGTEILQKTVAAGDTVSEFWGGNGLKMTSTQFLTGVAAAASAVTISITFEIGFQ